MRPFGRRKKKLAVAFHFQFANQAAWRCDKCREKGLEVQRRCGWLKQAEEPGRAVWLRGKVVAQSCPKSLITADSLAWLEQYLAWRAGGGGSLTEMPARTAEAFLILEQEWREESEHAQE